MINFKSLPISQPIVIGYQHHAYPLSIIPSHKDHFEWFLCNYTKLACIKSDFHSHWGPVNFFYSNDNLMTFCPLLESNTLSKNLLCNSNDIINFIINSIDNDQYIVTYVNEYYIPNRRAFNNFHNSHDIFIFGYDLNQQLFQVAGFTDNREYSITEVKFSSMREALIYFDQSTGFTLDRQDELILLNVNHDSSFEFSKELVLVNIKDYLESKNSSLNTICNNEYAYGLEVNNYIYHYIKSINESMDVRILHILWEHKKNMVLLINYLNNNVFINNLHSIYEEYQVIQKNVLILRNCTLKYNRTQNTKIIDSMLSNLEEIMVNEQKLLKSIIDLSKV